MKNLFILFAVFILPYASQGNALKPNEDSLLNVKAPDFQLKDSKGETVSLSSFKGKVVIIDFWATWCVPCHKSFPAVQKAVKHYAKDSDVVFLFLDTREKSADYVNLAKKDMDKNHYDFHVIFDEIGPEGIQNKYYKIFSMQGIPTKFIIDGNGIIRYKLVGYNPTMTDDEAAKELVQLIKRTKSLKS